MAYLYLYLTIGLAVTAVSYISNRKREQGVAEVIHNKLHELRDDGSFSFQSANTLGHLLAIVFSAILWPILVLKKILGR